MISRYKQLPLTGDNGDVARSIVELSNYNNFKEAVANLYNSNKGINPRQLSYIMQEEVEEYALDVMLGIEGKDNSSQIATLLN